MMPESEYAITLADGLIKYITAQYFEVMDNGTLLFYKNDDSVPFAAIRDDIWIDVTEVVTKGTFDNE
jgi:hypothetical protein